MTYESRFLFVSLPLIPKQLFPFNCCLCSIIIVAALNQNYDTISGKYARVLFFFENNGSAFTIQ